MSKVTPRNSILAALPSEEYSRIEPRLKLVSMDLNQILFRPEEILEYAYFPLDSVVSLLTTLEDGNGLEVGLNGREGLVGISAVLGGPETKLATVQGAGNALMISVQALS
jgi:CRP-like cAMP-binding protein